MKLFYIFKKKRKRGKSEVEDSKLKRRQAKYNLRHGFDNPEEEKLCLEALYQLDELENLEKQQEQEE